MRSLITTLLLIILASAAQADSLPRGVMVFHDDARAVTCWLYQGSNDGGISCLPDSQFRQQTHVGAEIPASTPTPRQQPEAFQL